MMKKLILTTCFLLAGMPCSAVAQEAEKAREHRGVRELIEQLGDPSYKLRREADGALRKLGGRAEKQLREASRGHEDAEVKSRASRILRALESGEANPGKLRTREDRDLKPQPRLRERPDDLSETFDSMFRRLELEFGFDIPRQRFFQDEFFKDLEGQVDEMRRRALDPRPGLKAPFEGQSQSMQMQMGPGGIKIKISERGEDGKLQTKAYEAPDMESFKKKFPEIAKRHLGGASGNGARSWSFNFGNSFEDVRRDERRDERRSIDKAVEIEVDEDATPRQLRLRLPSRQKQAEKAEVGPKLGVYVGREIPVAVREFLRIKEGVGLLVEEVVDGSLAKRLGVVSGDIILKIGDTAVGSPEEVSRELSKTSGEIRVTVNRRGVNRTLKASAGPVELPRKHDSKDSAEKKR